MIFECDECGDRRRRITLHKQDGSELHFCSTTCCLYFAETWDLTDFATGSDIGSGA